MQYLIAFTERVSSFVYENNFFNNLIIAFIEGIDTVVFLTKVPALLHSIKKLV